MILSSFSTQPWRRIKETLGLQTFSIIGTGEEDIPLKIHRSQRQRCHSAIEMKRSTISFLLSFASFYFSGYKWTSKFRAGTSDWRKRSDEYAGEEQQAEAVGNGGQQDQTGPKKPYSSSWRIWTEIRAKPFLLSVPFHCGDYDVKPKTGSV